MFVWTPNLAEVYLYLWTKGIQGYLDQVHQIKLPLHQILSEYYYYNNFYHLILWFTLYLIIYV